MEYAIICASLATKRLLAMAKQKLTKHFIESYSHPDNGQIFIRDTQISGFGIKVTKTAKTYFVERKLFGKTKRVTIGRHGALTLDEAKKQAKIVLGDLAKGVDVTRKRKQDDIKETQQLKKSKLELTTLKETYIDFLADSEEKKENTLKQYNHSIYHHLKCWLDTPIVTINQDMIKAKHKDMAETVPAQANYTMRVLRAVFNHAMETLVFKDSNNNITGYLLQRNPVLLKKSWAKVPPRTNYIKTHQLSEWWQATEQEIPLLRDYLRFVLLTGIRRENAASIKWSDIDFKDKSFEILGKKKDVRLPLPLSKYLLSMLEIRKQESTGLYVFPGKGKTGHLAEPKKAYKRIEQKTGIKATIHDLRRSYSKYAATLKTPENTIKCLLLHSLEGDVTGKHYIQHELEALKEPSQRIEDYIMNHIQKVDDVLPFTTNILKTG